MVLEGQPHAELDFTLWESGCKTKRSTRPDHCPIAKNRAWFQAVHCEWWSNRGADDIVHAGVVSAVGQVKSFRGELKRGLFIQFEGAAEPQVEIIVVRANTGIAAVSRRAVVGEVTVAVDVCTGEKIKGMAAVVVEDGRKLEATEDAGFFPGAFKHSCDDNLVALIKIRNRPITTQARCIKR